MPGIIDTMTFSWSRRVGRKVRNIKYTYAILIRVFISFGIFVFIGFYAYFTWVEQTIATWGIITTATMFLIIAGGMMSYVYFFFKLFVEEGSIEEKKLDERNLEKKFKLKMFYVTPKQQKTVFFIRFLMFLESIALMVASVLIFTLL